MIRMDPCEMKDLLGNDINVGDTIAYALLTGRSATLGIYQVIAIEGDKLRVQQTHRSYCAPNGRPSLISMPRRAVVLK
jgi:hypothetical protein